MTSNLAVVDDELMALAKELGFSPEMMEAQGNIGKQSNVYTSFTKVEDARIINGSKWLDGEIFKWCEPGQPDYEEEIEFSEINRLGGYLVNSEIQSSQSHKADAEDTMGTRLCSVVGYRNPVDGTYIKALPDFYPLTSMYTGWDKENNQPLRDSPNPVVSELDMLGSKGMRCVDCIKSKQSYNVGWDGKISECAPYGKLYFYITEVSRVKLTPPKGNGAPEEKITTKKISELYDDGRKGILVMFNLPLVTGLRGKYNKDEALSIVGYSSYIRGLSYKFKGANPRKNPCMNFTTISLRKPPAESTSQKRLLHFEDHPITDYPAVREAQAEWTRVKPKDAVDELDIADYGGKASVSYTVSDVPEPKYMTAVVDKGDETIPF